MQITNTFSRNYRPEELAPGGETLGIASSENTNPLNQIQINSLSQSNTILGPNGIKYRKREGEIEVLVPQFTINYLSPEELNDLFKRITNLRNSIQKLQGENTEVVKREIFAHYLSPTNGPKYLKHPVISQFVVDSTLGKSGDDSLSWQILGSRFPNFTLGNLKTNRNQTTTTTPEFFACTRSRGNPTFQSRYPSKAIPINISPNLVSPGMQGINTVSFFSQDHQLSNPKDPSAPALYILNRFLDRNLSSTSIAIENYVDQNTRSWLFPLISGLNKGVTSKDRQEIYQKLLIGYNTWLFLHEHKHSTGRFPLLYRRNRAEVEVNATKGYDLKKLRTGGTFEELRVDLNALEDSYGEEFTREFGREAEYLSEVLLSERLIGYPSRLDPQTSSDARTSHMLLNYLLYHQAITIDDENILKVVNREEFKNCISKLNSEMSAVEEYIDRLDLTKPDDFSTAKKCMEGFVRFWACHHSSDLRNTVAPNQPSDYQSYFLPENETKYPLHPFYEAIRKTIEGSKQSKRIKNSKKQTLIKSPYKSSQAKPVPDYSFIASWLEEKPKIKVRLYDPYIQDVHNFIRIEPYSKSTDEVDRQFFEFAQSKGEKYGTDLQENVYERGLLKRIADVKELQDFEGGMHDVLFELIAKDVEGSLDKTENQFYLAEIEKFLKNKYKEDYRIYNNERRRDDDTNDFLMRVRRILRHRSRGLDSRHAEDIRNRGAKDLENMKRKYLESSKIRKRWLISVTGALALLATPFITHNINNSSASAKPIEPSPRPPITQVITNPNPKEETTGQILAKPPEPNTPANKPAVDIKINRVNTDTGKVTASDEDITKFAEKILEEAKKKYPNIKEINIIMTPPNSTQVLRITSIGNHTVLNIFASQYFIDYSLPEDISSHIK